MFVLNLYPRESDRLFGRNSTFIRIRADSDPNVFS